MFDDRLEVESPGGLPGIVTVENIRRRHFSRNPQIVGVLKAWRYIEELGFGVDRVFREMEAASAPPPHIIDDGGVVIVTLYAVKPAVPKAVAGLGLNERQIRALAVLGEKGRITNREYRELHNVSHTTAAADLRDLVAKGLIEQVRTGRSTYYRAVDD
jgi:ATP-dependent DNA helicase RecG